MDSTMLLAGAAAAAGAVWAMDRWVWAPERRASMGSGASRPRWVGAVAGLFPVLVFVLLFRGFVMEPFRIPSGSMMPTLLPGDLILVDKHAYGLRLPVTNAKIWGEGSPERGDVVVFRYPKSPGTAYIKRVVGLPGDEVVYLDKRLVINGERQKTAKAASPAKAGEKEAWQVMRAETLGGRRHRILLDPKVTPEVKQVKGVSPEEGCRYSRRGIVCQVPEGHYFVMGDNRDNSLDSRYWGFVPEANVVGRAFFVMINLKNVKRFGRIE